MVTKKNVLTIYHQLAENKAHFKKMIYLENESVFKFWFPVEKKKFLITQVFVL